MATPEPVRWTEVSPSQFPHEAEGLQLVRELLPEQPPFHAWSNFEFRDGHGRWHEVDLLVLGRRRLHLVELKYYSGRLRGDDHTWLRDGRRAEDSPLKLARRKAQYFSSKLKDEFERWVRETKANAPPAHTVVPWVQESVFLHHPKFVSELSEASAIGLYGIDGQERHSNLPGISELLLEHGDPRRQIRERTIAELMSRIGLVQRREREAGSWVIREEAIADGDGWQEWEASHKISQQRRARIRIQVLPPTAPEAERRRVATIAEHEFRVMEHLNHQGVLRPEDLIDSDLGVGLVYPLDDDWQRLDLWLSGQPDGVSLETQLSIIRKAGEALQYAHGNKVVHRGLNPHTIWVREREGELRVQVRDWQSAGRVRAEHGTGTATGVTALIGADSARPESTDRWLDAFAAPEGGLLQGVDRVRVDVFGLGALAFFLLAGGRRPADSATELAARLRQQSGLDLAPELPAVSSAVREAVLNATRPAVSERTADVRSFLEQLADEGSPAADAEPDPDPLDAAPQALLGGRFRLLRRLGTGSTAVGLLVRDEHQEPAREVVLKVASSDAAADRLRDEAEVLRSITSPRIVKLLEGPIVVAGRDTLVLESAGNHTLAKELGDRQRQSLDYLERWGTDLLRALVDLDAAGIDHRDIKPANLGVRESRSDRAKHLVLFDFSLSRAAASAVRAGTPPYLDPFLGSAGRELYDTAAELYAAAVVLFEMATGQPPVYGDGLSDPAAISDEATVADGAFDRTVAQPLAGFFRTALARDRSARFDTAGDMLAAWLQVFGQTQTGAPDNATELQEAATPATPLSDAGLSARALSALEPFDVHTVADLVSVDAVRLARPSGVKELTRKEIRAAAARWRKKFPSTVRSRPFGTPTRTTVLPDPLAVAELLLDAVRADRSETRARYAAQILGTTPQPVDAFATQAQLGASLPKPITSGRGNQLITELHDAWGSDDRSRQVLDTLEHEVAARLEALGTVATVGELVDGLITVMVEDPASDDNAETRIVAGLLRVVVDRQRARIRGGQDDIVEYQLRRRAGRPALIGTDADILDVVEELGRVADRLVSAVNPGDATDALVPAARVAEELIATVNRADTVPDELRSPGRLARLAAALSTRSAASGNHELHHRGLSAAGAVSLSLRAVAAGQQLPPTELRDRVRARFPAIAALPERPALDRIVEESELDLVYDDRRRSYVTPQSPHDTTGLESRAPTTVAVALPALSVDGVVGQRLSDSIARRSFLALAPPAALLDRFLVVLHDRYDATMINITEVLLQAMREQAAVAKLPWAAVLSADAEASGSRAAQGLHALVGKAMPAVAAAIDTALTAGGSGPVVLTDASVLARYAALGTLSRWTDLATARSRPLWLVVPQLLADRGPVLEGRPLPLAAPGQFVAVDRSWIDSRRQPEGASA
ncbi:BREX system serine/threonine kinase PglW [Propionibacteriaceae bacterium Y2011]